MSVERTVCTSVSPAPEWMAAFPTTIAGIQTVGELLEEPSPLGVHARARESGPHRLLRCLLQRRSAFRRCARGPPRHPAESTPRGPASSMTRLPLPPSASRRATAVPMFPRREPWESPCPREGTSAERPARTPYNARPQFSMKYAARIERRRGAARANVASASWRPSHGARSLHLLGADGREHDDVRNARGLDCRRDRGCAAVVVPAHLARAEVRRKKDVGALRAAEGPLERGAVLDVGDGDIRARLLPRFSPWRRHARRRGPSSSAQAASRGDLARIPRSAKHDKH
jgi:hypothetical protein